MWKLDQLQRSDTDRFCRSGCATDLHVIDKECNFVPLHRSLVPSRFSTTLVRLCRSLIGSYSAYFSHLFYAVQIIKNNFFSHLYLSVERLLTKIWKNYITTLLTQQINIQQINISQIRIQRVHLSSWLQYILVDINIVRSSWKILELKSPNFNHSMVHMNRQCYIFFLPLWWSWTEHISSGCCCLPWN